MTTAKHDHDLRAAGAAALLKLMDIAREWHHSDPRWQLDVENRLDDVVEELEKLLTDLKPEPSHVWVPTTWGEIAPHGPGTRVRLGGVEAVVEEISAATWHVDPNSPNRSPRPLERTLVNVKLVGRVQVYQFPAANSVEVQDVNWPRVSEMDWAAAALAAQEERAIRLLGEAFGARKVPA